MIDRIKSKLLATSVILLGLIPLAVPVAVSAQNNLQQSFCQGVNTQAIGNNQQACGASGITQTTVNTGIQNVVNIISVVVGIIAVIMIIYAGFKYITSGGDTSKVSSAKTTILYALVGLVIVALAQVIVRFVVERSNTISGG